MRLPAHIRGRTFEERKPARTVERPFRRFLNPLDYIKDFNRFRQIVTVLAKHGFGQFVHEMAKGDNSLGQLVRSYGLQPSGEKFEPTTFAIRARLVFEDLGPTFIKLGQILSTRPDLVNVSFILELKRLQDNIPPFEFDEARHQIESELERPLNEMFEKLEETPLGTASIGQVYAARLKTGEDVVIKVQRPNVRKTIESDIDLMMLIAETLEARLRWVRAYDLTGILREFSKAIRKELDYSIELRNGLKFAEMFKDIPDVVIPQVYKNFSSSTVLTMERIRGVKINKAETIGCDRKKLAQVAFHAVLIMVFESGFFHADPHPGNIFALKGNRIAFLDLGMVGHLDEGMRYRMADLIVALLERDIEEIGRNLMIIGIREEKINLQQFHGDISEVMDKVVGLPLEDIQFSEIITDLLEGARRHHLRIPNEYSLMGKALLTIEALGKELDPELNIESEVAPFIQKLVMARYSTKHITRTLSRRLNEFYHWSHELPQHVMTILDDLQAGNLRVKVEQLEQGQMLRNLEAIAGKLSAGLIISSLIISSSLFLTFSRLEYQVFGFPVTMILGVIGYLAAAILGIRMVRAVVKAKDREEP